MRNARVLTAALVLTLLTPLASGHASPNPIDVEVHVLDDESDDTFGRSGVFDISDVYVREAQFPGGGPGLVVRVFLYGGFVAPSTASTMSMEVDVTSDQGTHTVTATTTDGVSWTGDAIVEQEMEDEDGIQQGYLQVFVSLDDLGATVGDTVGPFAVRTLADGDVRDVAPGGIPVPGTGGEVLVPAESTVVRETMALEGPVGYTNTQVTLDAGVGAARVENLIAATGQHISFRLEAPTGWTVTLPEPAAASIEPGQDLTFAFSATADRADRADATVTVVSDLGGWETITLSAADAVGAGPAPVEPTPGGGPDEEQPTPAPLLLAPLALGVAALLRRR